MGRLIDADKITDSLGISDMDFAIGTVIDEQPIAFDADKVAEQFRRYIYEIPLRLNRDNIPFQVGSRFGLIKYSNEPVKFYFDE